MFLWAALFLCIIYTVVAKRVIKIGYINYNPNPKHARVGDCAVRCIAKATGTDWQDAYIQLAIQGYVMRDLPSADIVWGEYLRLKGFHREAIPEEKSGDYTVRDFCADNPTGTYVIKTDGHVVCVVDGDYYDSWDSGEETPLYYWRR